MKELILKRCNKCGALIKVLNDCNSHGCGIICCDDSMELLKPNTSDAAAEKHVPVVEKVNDIINVTINHVMDEDHYIEWIAYISDNREEFVYLKAGDNAKTEFKYEGKAKVYAYCNKHDLWVTDID